MTSTRRKSFIIDDLKQLPGSSSRSHVVDNSIPSPSSNQTSKEILKGVLAYIEIRTKDDDRFDCVANQVRLLGGEATRKFTADVTHVIYRDGLKATRDKAIKKAIPIVTVNWVEACRTTGTWATERDYTIDFEKYNSPLYHPVRRIFPLRSREITSTEKRNHRARERKRSSSAESVSTPSPATTTTHSAHSNAAGPSTFTPSRASENRSSQDDVIINNETIHPFSNDEDGESLSLIQRIAKHLQSKPVKHIDTPTKWDTIEEDKKNEVTVDKTTKPAKKNKGIRKLLNLKDSPNKSLPDPFKEPTGLRKRKRSETDESGSTGNNKENTSKRKVAKTEQKSVPSSARTSLEDFVSTKTVKEKSAAKRSRRSSDDQTKKPMRSLVMTSMHFSDQDIVISVVQKLGSFSVQDHVTPGTTHVICGDQRRTLNVLKGICRGCWFLSLEWVVKSLEAGHWIEEEPFELNDMFPSAQLCRLERSASKGLFHSRLLSDVGAIFIDRNTCPPSHELNNLVQISGGQICTTFRKASVCIGDVPGKTEGVQVTEKWLLDCITSQTVLPFDQCQKNLTPKETVRPDSPIF